MAWMQMKLYTWITRRMNSRERTNAEAGEKTAFLLEMRKMMRKNSKMMERGVKMSQGMRR